MPARFSDPTSWQTHDLILVGLEGEEVKETLDLKMKHGFNPRESNVACAGNKITITELSRGAKPKKRVYYWDGKKLKSKRS
jgi:hypothetical protein